MTRKEQPTGVDLRLRLSWDALCGSRGGRKAVRWDSNSPHVPLRVPKTIIKRNKYIKISFLSCVASKNHINFPFSSLPSFPLPFSPKSPQIKNPLFFFFLLSISFFFFFFISVSHMSGGVEGSSPSYTQRQPPHILRPLKRHFPFSFLRPPHLPSFDPNPGFQTHENAIIHQKDAIPSAVSSRQNSMLRLIGIPFFVFLFRSRFLIFFFLKINLDWWRRSDLFRSGSWSDRVKGFFFKIRV